MVARVKVVAGADVRDATTEVAFLAGDRLPGVDHVPTRGKGRLIRSARRPRWCGGGNDAWGAELPRSGGLGPGAGSMRAVARLTEGKRARRTAPEKGRPPPGGRAGVAERSRSGCGRQNRLPRKLRCAQDQVTNRLRGDSMGYV